jgi:hypothetical protein
VVASRIKPYAAIVVPMSCLLAGCSAYLEVKPPPERSADARATPRYSNHIDQTVYARAAPASVDVSADVSDDPQDASDPDLTLTATGRAPTTSPATAPAGDLSLADAPPIDTVIRQRSADQVEFLRTLQPVNSPAIYFGHVLASDPVRKSPRTIPLIATRDQNRWKAIEVGDARAVNATWAYIGAGPEQGHAWGVLEPPPPRDGSGTYLLLVHTNDSGATWRTIPLLKPSTTARYDSICMSRYRGRVTVYQPPGASGARSGYYHYQTTDHGATWDTPTFEPDGLTPADPVSDEERQRLRQRGPSRAADAQ